MKPSNAPCALPGPRAEVTVTVSAGGKPPRVSLRARMHLINPLDRDVVLLFNDGLEGLESASSVIVSRTSSKPPVFLWTFSGAEIVDALPLAPKSDIVLNEVELDATRGAEAVSLTFVSDLRIAGRPARVWLRASGVSPRGGEFSLANLEQLLEKQADELNPPPVTLRVLCTQTINVEAWTQ
ncbi:MAG TPA: hypothetical protein VFQ61_36455 [Polyangiaceae bacterium]|nr:hypothetical protein [Polyangiaceae bacterium]